MDGVPVLLDHRVKPGALVRSTAQIAQLGFEPYQSALHVADNRMRPYVIAGSQDVICKALPVSYDFSE
jgi:hypothetical protein